MSRFNQIRNSVLGFVIGDAVGVPFEFTSRADLLKEPATEMEGHGTHNQPIGTWSDDSSMMFILMEWLIGLKKAGKKFTDVTRRDYVNLKIEWFGFYEEGTWTPHDNCFDIGGQTRKALLEIDLWGDIALDPRGQGNGALMRILPFGFFRWSGEEFLYAVKTVMLKTCEITHGNVISNYYCERHMGHINHTLFGGLNCVDKEMKPPALDNGWVVTTYDTVKYAINNRISGPTNEVYKKCILDAINLGEDTDTVAAITGGLLGASFDGKDDLPQDWLSKIVKLDQIEDLIVRFYETFKLEIEGE